MGEYHLRLINDVDLAVLHTVVTLLHELPLQAVESIHSAGADTVHVQSRLFHRYFLFFTKVIDRWCLADRDREVRDRSQLFVYLIHALNFTRRRLQTRLV